MDSSPPLPSLMLETDARLPHLTTYKRVCTKQETDWMRAAGDDLTLAVLSKVGVVDEDTAHWEQTGAVLEPAHPILYDNNESHICALIAREMASLVMRLHARGIVHGAICLEAFVRAAEAGTLRIVDFSRAQVLTSAVAPVAGDILALAVSLCAVFSGSRPSEEQFRPGAALPDLGLITDPELFCAIFDALEKVGLGVECEETRARRGWVGMAREVSTSLDLFDGENATGARAVVGGATTPRFCPHCFEAARSGEPNKNNSNQEGSSGSCSKQRPVLRSRDRSASDYAMQWLAGQQQGQRKAVTLSVNTDSSLDDDAIDSPLWSATTVTVTGTAKTAGRGRSSTVIRISPPSVSSSSEWDSDGADRRPASQSSRETTVDGSVDTDDIDDASNCSLPPLTPMPARLKLLHVTEGEVGRC